MQSLLQRAPVSELLAERAAGLERFVAELMERARRDEAGGLGEWLRHWLRHAARDSAAAAAPVELG